ncbi:transcriptional regulator [Cnuibacter physcomitrellae]|uniref:Uncharacterized protein n=1 Tax=Cnuibacter physcomitrellae TaxID=1619308 RepID=A0A1X9LNT0_9MICO|nr:GntR family transcriptional regulator [Cnuibacter physcomitrellae]ARJ06833.1 hypothetical protein B5808_17600 [Cnuibacter physcomitrellae]GGI38942.1 transcriptional regulator [Cnuibacter physcomitrellae]
MSGSSSGWQGKADIVYALLRSDIETAKLAPGQTLSEIDLVDYTGASRTPVREAIRRLAADGLVELEPRRAPTVSRISLRSARALFEFRRILEPAAIRLVAAAAESDQTLHSAIEELQDRFTELSTMEFLASAPDRFTDATAEFDALLSASTPNEYLRRSITDLRPHSARLRHIAHSDRSRIRDSIGEHLTMCQSILSSDPDRAADAMTAHLNHVEEAIFRHLLTASDAELLVS